MPADGFGGYPEVGAYGGYPEVGAYPEVEAYPQAAPPPQASAHQPSRKKRVRNGGFDEAEMANMPMLEITQEQVKNSINSIDPDFLEEQRAIAEGKAQATISAKIFNRNTGQVQMTNMPSKLAKRKHQIHTLALQAKEREVMMQHKKGKMNLTKAQTQAKYGW
jgi:hypothetical protein